MAQKFPWRRPLAAVLVLSALGASPAAAAEVALFADTRYVDDRSGSNESEVDNLRSDLLRLGHRVTDFTGIAATDFTAATAGKAALVIPELETGTPAPALSPAAETAIRDYVERGGVLIAFADQEGRAVVMLNQIFGYALDQASCRSLAGIQSYTGLLHAGPETQATVLDRTCDFLAPPPEARGLVKSGAWAVATIPEGDGYVVLLGWDWYGNPLVASNDATEVQGHQVWRGVLDDVVGLGAPRPGPGTPTNEPGATLLIPYFKVNLDNPAGFDTLFSVNNAAPAARLSSITLWTDWGVPSLTFHLYLTGFDVQTISLRSIFNGSLPTTGLAVVPAGPISGPNVEFPSCDASNVAGLTLDSLGIAQLRALHAGESNPLTGRCGGSPQPAGIVAGYVTVDVVTHCDVSLNPSTPGYFGPGGIATSDNVLYGDVVYVDRSENFAQGTEAVSIRADDDAYEAGDYTFYGRYLGGDASDARQPLFGTYLTRYFAGGVFSGGTTLYVWRDNKSADAAEVDCAEVPPWAPLAEQPTWVFDEDEDAVTLSSDERFPYLVQEVGIPGPVLDPPFDFGMLVLDLNHDGGNLFADRAQAWVVTVLRASGLYSVGYPAIMVEEVFASP